MIISSILKTVGIILADRHDWRHRLDPASKRRGQTPKYFGEQVARTPETSIEIKKVETGKGHLARLVFLELCKGVLNRMETDPQLMLLGAMPSFWKVGLPHYLMVAAILFTLGIFGIFLNRKNVIVILMSVELMLLAVNINLVAFSADLGDLTGQIFTLFVLTVAAAEAAIGLAIIIIYYRNKGSIAVDDIHAMKG